MMRQPLSEAGLEINAAARQGMVFLEAHSLFTYTEKAISTQYACQAEFCPGLRSSDNVRTIAADHFLLETRYVSL
jgi:hypothetical protein